MRENRKRSTRQAKSLRRRMTKAEIGLWSRLRRKGLGMRFRRQHPIGPYIVDFACAPLRLVIEVDGGTHFTIAQRARDDRRTAFLEAEGWRVLRFRNLDVYDSLDDVVERIAAEIPPPSASPPPPP